MKSIECIEHYKHVNRKLGKALIFGAVTAGVGAAAYIGSRKLLGIIEDKRLARYYEDEIEEIFKEKEKMQFYEDEFIRQEEEEQEELEKVVDEFNSKRLKREECPRCSENKGRIKNKRREKTQPYKTTNEYDG
ncbi:hypothetical protein [Terrisporobacter mayombei]|uniref:YtxH domain-containing protein n=1 Tax=Terrisporobacter mayombei TaxID=1541 RepID=A0ABY9PZX7_9FIRM|nr:hypothetical protein [Terrisporobacter mayombei]MCC3867016.1 hypothetical protein [Terrisporobacter mayombei]WMT81275.1 hypothetical protein TEMA_16140 [Terrisporobacter mayombei]